MEFQPKLQSINGSYLLGWLENIYPVFDHHLVEKPLPTTSHLVYIDDEMHNRNDKKLPDRLIDQQHVYICKTSWVSNYLTSQGCKNILFPWFVLIDQCISMRWLKDDLMIEHPQSTGEAYFCLNRGDRPHRRFLVEYLHEQDLLSRGVVTYRENTPDLAGIRAGDDMVHFVDDRVGFERHQKEISGIWISSIIDNFLKINQRYSQPVNISAETATYDFFPTEKSMLAFATKRLPLIYANEFCIKNLRDQGFDLFDWVLDHSYDKILDYKLRGKNLVDLNHGVLENTITVDSRIKKALDYNYDFLINDWLETSLKNLQIKIENLL